MQWEWYGPPFTLGIKPARVIHSTQFTKRHTRIEQCVLSRDINHLVKAFQLLQAKRLSRGWRLGHFCLTHIATLAPRETRNASYHADEPLLLYAVIGFLLLLISFLLPLLTILADHEYEPASLVDKTYRMLTLIFEKLAVCRVFNSCSVCIEQLSWEVVPTLAGELSIPCVPGFARALIWAHDVLADRIDAALVGHCGALIVVWIDKRDHVSVLIEGLRRPLPSGILEF